MRPTPSPPPSVLPWPHHLPHTLAHSQLMRNAQINKTQLF